MKKIIITLFIYMSVFPLSRQEVNQWPVLRHYDQEHTYKIALPLGGIGTGTVSLGGRGNLQDWEIMNKPAKGYNPGPGRHYAPFFALFTESDGKKDTRLLEGPLPFFLYDGYSGSEATNSGLPRFRENTFDAAYPFGQVNLSTPEIPVNVKIKAFNPLIPGDVDKSSIPIAVVDFELTNTSNKEMTFSICGSMQNFIGKGKAKGNKNIYRTEDQIKGIFFSSEGVDKQIDEWGEMALVSPDQSEISYRTSWLPMKWGSTLLDFWDDFSKDGELENRRDSLTEKPIASLAVRNILPPKGTKTVRFILTWYFPNRTAWSSETLKNYYATQYTSAWDVVSKTLPKLEFLENKTKEFVNAFCSSNLPDEIKEAALFNISTLRTQTCFRLSDGNFYGWEGCADNYGSCFGNCTHVWNYETVTPFLFGELAKTMRNIEFNYDTDSTGFMSFRTDLPLSAAGTWKIAAADGQMGCLIKLYREWQLSGDDDFLRRLYPKAKEALSYAWRKGGWDADQDGVMEGIQHNTMDVEYYGPNPQMTLWYLGALRAMEKMAEYLHDESMKEKCRQLFEHGSAWTDQNLFNGEYYIQKIMVPDEKDVNKELLGGQGAADYNNPDYQLGEGCLVDQLVGQHMARICDLGYLVKKENVEKTLQSIMKYNYQPDQWNHFNPMRSYVLGDEAGLLMASYPRSRLQTPFPYFTEVMSGFEYAAAVGMLQEGQTENGLKCISNIRSRYDGRKRSPFCETEAGYHYVRAMASWSSILAMTGFHYSAVTKELKISDITGKYFWSNGYAYGTIDVSGEGRTRTMTLDVLNGKIELSKVTIEGFGTVSFEKPVSVSGQKTFKIEASS